MSISQVCNLCACYVHFKFLLIYSISREKKKNRQIFDGTGKATYFSLSLPVQLFSRLLHAAAWESLSSYQLAKSSFRIFRHLFWLVRINPAFTYGCMTFAILLAAIGRTSSTVKLDLFLPLFGNIYNDPIILQRIKNFTLGWWTTSVFSPSQNIIPVNILH